MELLAAYFSKIINCDVVPETSLNNPNYVCAFTTLPIGNRKPAAKLTIEKLYEICMMSGDCGDSSVNTEATVNAVTHQFGKLGTHSVVAQSRGIEKEKNSNCITVKTLTGKTITVDFDPELTISGLKQIISASKLDVPVADQRLLYGGKTLESDSNTLADCLVSANSTLYLIVRGKQDRPLYSLSGDFLDPKYDYDFTDKVPDGKKCYRGNEEYFRPYGWKRYAVKVLNRYGDNVWLGADGMRSDSTPGEWPVTYHGTGVYRGGTADFQQVKGRTMAEHGSFMSRGQNFIFSRGIYSTPTVETAEFYADSILYGGQTYKCILQNRVNPATLQKVGPSYWLSPKEADIRLYGILMKKI